MTDARARPYEPFAFAAFGADGAGRGPNAMLRFDDDRNWELVARLLSDPDARVQHIFVSNAIQRRLLRTAARRRAPRSVVARAEQVMVQPSHGHPHANHFHVRVYCNPHERPRCRDRAPFHAWYPGVPPPKIAAGPVQRPRSRDIMRGMRGRARWTLGLVAASLACLALVLPALAQQTERGFSADERRRLEEGELVARPVARRRGALRSIGGSSWQVIDQPPR
ncbi:MAG: penicillin-insensitive murein endopeptidase [Sandaracinaceae bacterium]|nr:penicillin-insensitive murein endopeptidase [Sandaracinaceae bacterium]